MDQPIATWIAELAKPSVAERLRAITALEAMGPAAFAALPALHLGRSIQSAATRSRPRRDCDDHRASHDEVVAPLLVMTTASA